MRRGMIVAALLAAVLFSAPTRRSEADELPPNRVRRATIAEALPTPSCPPAEETRSAPKLIPRREAPPAPEIWREDIPLRAELQEILLEESNAAGIDPLIIVGLIETESGFREDAVSPTGDYGLCQLNHHYFDPSMTPEENLRAGIGLLALHLQRYGSIEAALTAYHVGHDDGTRSYARIVLGKAAGWGYGA